jgi:hypothetical protein
VDVFWIILAIVALAAVGLLVMPFLPAKSSGNSAVDIES